MPNRRRKTIAQGNNLEKPEALFKNPNEVKLRTPKSSVPASAPSRVSDRQSKKRLMFDPSDFDNSTRSGRSRSRKSESSASDSETEKSDKPPRKACFICRSAFSDEDLFNSHRIRKCFQCYNESHAHCVKFKLSMMAREAGSSPSTTWNCGICNLCTICNKPIELEKHAIDCSLCEKRIHRTCNTPIVHHKTIKANFICQSCGIVPENKEKHEKMQKIRLRRITINRMNNQRRRSRFISETKTRRLSENPLFHSARMNASNSPFSGLDERVDLLKKQMMEQQNVVQQEMEVEMEPSNAEKLQGFPGFSRQEIEKIQIIMRNKDHDDLPANKKRKYHLQKKESTETQNKDLPELQLKDLTELQKREPKIPESKNWSVTGVRDHFRGLFPEHCHVFTEHLISGKALQYLTRDHVIYHLFKDIKLGPAMKIYREVVRLQTKSWDPTLPFTHKEEPI